MAPFIEKMRVDSGFDLCGRMIRDGDSLQVYIDEIGGFTIPGTVLSSVLMGLGDGSISGSMEVVVRLSESGKGLYLDIGGVSYASPVTRVRAVMRGDQRKGPVSRVR